MPLLVLAQQSLATNIQWGMYKTPLNEVSLYIFYDKA
jgi:hypothetical protein